MKARLSFFVPAGKTDFRAWIPFQITIKSAHLVPIWTGDRLIEKFKGTLSSQTCKSHFCIRVKCSMHGRLRDTFEVGDKSLGSINVTSNVVTGSQVPFSAAPPCSPKVPSHSETGFMTQLIHWFLLTEYPDVWHGAATNIAFPYWILFCAYLLIMVIELPNLGSNFPNLPPLQPIPIVQYLSISQERKERLKGIPEFLRTSHQTRQRAIVGPNSAFINGVAFPIAVPHRANCTAYTHQNKDHLSCIILWELDTSMLHKIHTTKGHNFPGEHSDYAGTVRCERSEPTLQQDASHHSRWVLHCRSHHPSFSLVIH